MFERARAFLNKYYVPSVLGLIIFLAGIWIGQNYELGLGSQKGRTVLNLFNRGSPPSGVKVDFGDFWEVWDILNEQYLDRADIDQQKLLYGAISGLVGSLGDPYTVFLDPESNESFNSELSGTYEGVGIEIGAKDGRLIVVAPIDGTPAASANVVAGDIIAQIDGKSTLNITIPQAVNLIRGEAGTQVELVLVRGGETIEVAIKRAKITVKSVIFTDKGSGIAQIKITRFGDSTQGEWDGVVNKFVSGGFSKLILDLRNDPGGRLDTAIYIAGEFVPEGTIVVQEEDSSAKKQAHKTDRAGRLQSVIPIVLINKGSASASEIVAGALRDLKKSELVGETSFGKGTVQKVEELEGGSSLHITVAKWLTPAGTWVNGIGGLKPDVEVTLTPQQAAAGKDPQLEKALQLVK